MSKPLPRFTQTALTADPIQILLAQREAAETRAREAINAGTDIERRPLNPRGWPIQTKGVGGTSPGTSPHQEASAGRLDNHRTRNVR